MIKKIGSGMKEPRFLQPMTLEFNSIFHPDPLENFEFAKEILNGVKQIEISNDKMIYSSWGSKPPKPPYWLTAKPFNWLKPVSWEREWVQGNRKFFQKIEIEKGITLYILEKGRGMGKP